MKKKRILAIAAAAVLAVSMMAGCGKESDPQTEEKTTGKPATSEEGATSATGTVEEQPDEEIVDLEMWMTNSGYKEIEKGSVMYEFYKDKIGVGLTTPYVEWNGGKTYQEQLNLKIAAGEMPDLFLPVNGMEADLIAAGALLDLTDLLPEYAPDLWNLVPPEIWDAMRAYDPSGNGRIYCMPTVTNFALESGLIRQDWLDNLGLEMPKTLDEFVDVLRAFKTLDPNGNGIADEIPTGGRMEARWMDHLFAFYGVAMWEGFPQFDLYGDELTYSAVTPNMRDALKFISELYAEGLIDPETLLNDSVSWEGKIVSDRVGVYYHWATGVNQYARQIYESTGNKADFAVLPCFSADGYEGFYTAKKISGIHLVAAATTDEKKIQAVMKVLNSYGDLELTEDLYWGPQKMYWDYDESGRRVMLGGDKSERQILLIQPHNAINRVDFNIELWNNAMDESTEWMYNQCIRNISENQKYGRTIASDGMPSSIFDGNDEINNRTLYVEYASKIITGEYPIEKFDEFVEKWYQYGGQDVTDKAREWYAKTQN